MNDESVGLITVRAASRQCKSCAFKRAMLIRLAERYDLDGPPPSVLGSDLMIRARLSHCVQWPEEENDV